MKKSSFEDKYMSRTKNEKKSFLYYLIILLTAIIGILLGIFLYLYQSLNNVNYVNINGINTKHESQEKKDFKDTAIAIKEGEFGHLKVNVDPDFPINYVPKKDPLVENILVFGIDSRGEEISRADAIMIVSLNKRDHSIKLTSILRDTEIALNDETGNRAKINASYAYGGVGMLINTINYNFDLDIQKFFMFDFWSAAELIDTLGGVSIDVTQKEVYGLNDVLRKDAVLYDKNLEDLYINNPGKQKLNGIQATSWARIRSIDSDFGRTARQRQLAETIISEFSNKDFISQLDFGINVLGHLETNVNKNHIMGLGLDTVQNMNTINKYYVPQEGMYEVNYDNWNMIYDPNTQIPALHEFIWAK